MDGETPQDDEGIDDDSDHGDDKQDHGDAAKKKRRERRQVTTSTKEATYPMATGEIFLQWPERISAEEAEDITEWLAIMTRKIKRSVVSDELEEPETYS